MNTTDSVNQWAPSVLSFQTLLTTDVELKMVIYHFHFLCFGRQKQTNFYNMSILNNDKVETSQDST